jgi:hypothetical protein
MLSFAILWNGSGTFEFELRLTRGCYAIQRCPLVAISTPSFSGALCNSLQVQPMVLNLLGGLIRIVLSGLSLRPDRFA